VTALSAATTRKGKRVLLLNPPGDRPYLRDYYCSSVSKSGYYWHPIDLLVLSGRLSSACCDLKVVDAVAELLTVEETFQRVCAWSPDIVIFLTSATSWPQDQGFLRRTARSTGARMIGCGEIFLGPVDSLFRQHDWLEAGIKDFTDPGIPDYLEAFHPARGILLRGKQEGAEDPEDEHNGLISYGIPRHELFPLDRYHYPWNRYHPYASLLTTYGCPFRCRFCNSGFLGFRMRDLGDIHAELSRIREMNIRQVFVKDMSFGANRDHAQGFCRLLQERGVSMSWNCYVRLDTMTSALLEDMARAGCCLIQVGLETANETVARRMAKPLDRDRAGEVFRLCGRLGIRTGAHFVMGLPGETEQGLEETVALARELNPDYCSFNLFVPRHGSPFGSLLGDEGTSREAVPCHEAAGGPGPETERCFPSGVRYGDPVLDPSEAFPSRSFCAMDPESLFRWRNRAYRAFYLRPAYLIKQGFQWRTRTELMGALRDGWGLGKNLFQLSARSLLQRRD